jgi:hypothetical protein
MLNEYHVQFLRLLNEQGVRYLVIGGQARFAHCAEPTKDLDIWVDISAGNRPPLERCMADWKAKHPMHTLLDMTPPLEFRRNVQIKFPDADAWFMGRDNQPTEILAENGIDVLTSVGDADFDAYFAGAVTMQVDGLDVPFLAAADLEIISPSSSSR